MTRKPPKTPAHARRRIERLEAQVAALREAQAKAWRAYAGALSDLVECRTRVDQAARILTGKDEEVGS